MMLRYGFSGTNWTRKTTTIERLVARLSPVPVEVVSLSKLVAKSPHPMRDKQTVAGSEWMLEQVGPVMSSPRSSAYHVFDRTPLDIMAFTRYALDTSGGDESICDRIAALSAHFDVIFYCPPDGEWPAPVEPPAESKEFALRVASLMEASCALMRTQVRTLPWDADARLESVLDWIEERHGASKDA